MMNSYSNQDTPSSIIDGRDGRNFSFELSKIVVFAESGTGIFQTALKNWHIGRDVLINPNTINYCIKTYHSIDNLPKTGMLPVQPWCLDRCDVKLGSVGIFPRICHAHPSWSIMFQDKILVIKILPIYTFGWKTQQQQQKKRRLHPLNKYSPLFA